MKVCYISARYNESPLHKIVYHRNVHTTGGGGGGEVMVGKMRQMSKSAQK